MSSATTTQTPHPCHLCWHPIHEVTRHLRKPLLLIVDDDDDMRDTLRMILEANGYAVTTAANGEEGLARLCQVPAPDLALVDLMMPFKDGWDFVSGLRESARFSRMPIVVMSAFGARALAMAPTAVACLRKPVEPERLLDVVERALSPAVADARREQA